MDVHWLQLVVYIVVYSLEMVTGFVTFFIIYFLFNSAREFFDGESRMKSLSSLDGIIYLD